MTGQKDFLQGGSGNRWVVLIALAGIALMLFHTREGAGITGDSVH
jgi:hypothetical protein